MAPEDPWDVWRKRGFPGFPPGSGIPPDFFAEFEKEFARMSGMINRIMEDAMKHASSPQRDQPFVYGFSMRIGKDGVPQLTPFGSASNPVTHALDPAQEEVREPLTDILESDKEISVTVELPGVEKENVSLHVAEEAITVRVDKGPRRYRKTIQLPAKVVAATAKATFKNSILDVTVARKGDREDVGQHVAID